MARISRLPPKEIHSTYEKIIKTPNSLEEENGFFLYKKEMMALQDFLKKQCISDEQNRNLFSLRYGHLIHLTLPFSIFIKSFRSFQIFEYLESLEIRLYEPSYLMFNELVDLPPLRFVEIIFDDLFDIALDRIKLPNFKSLYISDVDFSRIRFNISNFYALEKLRIEGSQMETVPNSVFELKNLKQLLLKNNMITLLPNSIEKLKNVEILDFSENFLTSIPEAILNLKALKKLYLRDNGGLLEDAPSLRIISALKNRGCEVFI